MLVMGPWSHGGWSRGDGQSLGPISFNAKTADFFRESIELPFFEFYLKGKGPLKHPKAWVFQTGANQWRQFAAWPPREARPKAIFLRAGGRLAFDPPADADREACYDEYVSDPAKPVPFLNKIAIGMSPEYMVEDQRFAATRPDVLVYQTEALEEDLAVGRPDPGRTARLHVGNRRGLDRQADRRVPGRLSRSQRQPRRRCAWAVTSNWFAAT